MTDWPRNPYPSSLRRIFRLMLPVKLYHRYVGLVCKVPAVTLESWICESIAPSLRKSDVERAEPGILLAGKKVLQTFKLVILCEVLTSTAGEAIWATLPPFYSFWHINENWGLTEQGRITRRCGRNKNWLFVPDPGVERCPSE